MSATPIVERVLLTNDDGIDAPGLAVLVEVASQLAREVWVVAPAEDQSGTSHSLSLHEPLRAVRRAERSYAVRGTPGDCVALAIGRLMKDARPDLILSGVNRGTNLGTETVFSGTVGGAMMGLLFGIPAIALSQTYTKGTPIRWETAREHAPAVLRTLIGARWASDACLNVNFPDRAPADVKPLVVTTQGAGLLSGIEVVSGTDPREIDYHWITFSRAPQPEDAGSEATRIMAGHITVTPLQFERTHEAAADALRRALPEA
jgi:5'-nucleotidase